MKLYYQLKEGVDLEGERHLGGLVSASLKRGEWYGGWAGYGIYVTDRRILGVKKRKYSLGWLSGTAIGRGIGSLVGSFVYGGTVNGTVAGAVLALAIGFITESATTNLTPERLSDFLERKDFDVSRDQILEIEMRKPGIRFGYLRISLRLEESIKIQIGYRHVFHRLRNLMTEFSAGEPSIPLVVK